MACVSINVCWNRIRYAFQDITSTRPSVSFSNILDSTLNSGRLDFERDTTFYLTDISENTGSNGRRAVCENDITISRHDTHKKVWFVLGSWQNSIRVLGYHSGRGFHRIRQPLSCISIATSGGFPGIPVRNGRKEHALRQSPTPTSSFIVGSLCVVIRLDGRFLAVEIKYAKK